jgi:hypothetical protein
MASCTLSPLTCPMAGQSTSVMADKRERERRARLAEIRLALNERCSDLCESRIGLTGISRLCRTTGLSLYGAQFARSELLQIATDWDLAHDTLEGQSDECIQHIAEVLRL